MPSRNIRIIFVSIIVAYVCYVRADRNPYTRHVARAFNEIHRSAWYNVKGEVLLDGAVAGMVDKLHEAGDRHAEFIAAVRASARTAEIEQQFGGVGIVISLLGTPPTLHVIAQPEPGTPAAQAGVQLGDTIEAIDGKTIGLLIRQAIERGGVDSPLDALLPILRGPVGSEVQLTIRRKNQAETPFEKLESLLLRRAIIKTASIKGHSKNNQAEWNLLLPQDTRIAHIRLTIFASHTVEELETTLAMLQKQGAKGIILDLREDGGGLLPAAVGVSDLFLKQGEEIVTIRNRFRKVKEQYKATGRGMYQDIPLVVIVNRRSASASEIVAACLKDNQRALVVGERTYGKGTVQQMLNIGPPVKSYRQHVSPKLKLTTATYWRPNGHNINREALRYKADAQEEWGVRPSEGCEVKQSDQESITFARYWRGQDLYNPNGLASPNDEKQTQPYIDIALELAIKKLQTALDK